METDIFFKNHIMIEGYWFDLDQYRLTCHTSDSDYKTMIIL